MVADRAHDRLFLGGLEDVVVLIIGADRLQIAIARAREIAVALLEQEEFELGRHHRLVTELLQALALDLEDLSRRLRHRLVGVVVEKIAQDHRRAFEPGHPPHGRKVRLHHVVAVTRLPARRRVAVGRGHLQVGGQHVVAAMGFLVGAFEEVGDVETLAHQASLHVHAADENGVDFAGVGRLAEFLDRKITGHGATCLEWLWAWSCLTANRPPENREAAISRQFVPSRCCRGSLPS